VSILDSMFGRREPTIKYRTVDGGHPAPYPDMTDAQLYAYETTFRVPKKTFDKPPAGAASPAARTASEPRRPATAHQRRATNQATSDPGLLDLSKPVRTVTSKQPVEIITTRARHPVYKVLGYIGDDQVATMFTLDGRISENGPRFLENAPGMQRLYLNIYPNRSMDGKERFLLTQHETKEAADAEATPERIACVPLQFDQ